VINIAPTSAGKNPSASVASVAGSLGVIKAEWKQWVIIDRVTTFKLAGVHVSDDLKWPQHFQAICAMVFLNTKQLLFFQSLKTYNMIHSYRWRKGRNVWEAECPRRRCPGIVRTPYATADRAGLPIDSQGRCEEPVLP